MYNTHTGLSLELFVVILVYTINTYSIDKALKARRNGVGSNMKDRVDRQQYCNIDINTAICMYGTSCDNQSYVK